MTVTVALLTGGQTAAAGATGSAKNHQL